MIHTIQRDTAIACMVMAALALVVRPEYPRLAAGVVGGGILVGLAWWAIRGMVDQMIVADENGQTRPVSRGFALVKFFTRHGILALAAYGMMVRLRLDPIGMLAGVSSLVLAATVAATRRR